MTDQERLRVFILRSEPRYNTNPQHTALFVLYCVVEGLCSTASDFEHLFGTHLPHQHHLARLIVEGFLVEDKGRYFATNLGVFALIGFSSKEKET